MPPLRDFKPRSPALFRTRLGSRIRETRSSLNLTQREVASYTGLAPDRIAKYEAGTNPPPVYALTKIAEVLSRPVDLLLPELHLAREEDRDLYRVYRDLWSYPAELRANCVRMLRLFLACADLPERRLKEEGPRHVAASRR